MINLMLCTLYYNTKKIAFMLVPVSLSKMISPVSECPFFLRLQVRVTFAFDF